MVEGYDVTAKRVNESYAMTQNIRETMKDTKLPFDCVFEAIGFKDEFDFADEPTRQAQNCKPLHNL